MKDAIRAKKLSYKASLHNKAAASSLRARYAETRKSVALVVNKFRMQCSKYFGLTLDSNYWPANKVFWQTIQGPHGKRSHIARSIKDQNGVLPSNKKDNLGWLVLFHGSSKKCHCHTTGHTRCTFGGGKCHHCSWSVSSCPKHWGLGRLQAAMKSDLKFSKPWI